MIYVFYTWLLANLMHPVVVFFYFGADTTIDADMLLIGFQIFIYGLIFSLPSLLISLLFVHFLLRIQTSGLLKFTLLIMMAPVIVAVNLLILLLIFSRGIGIKWHDLELAEPAIIATEIVILVRYRYFFKIISNRQDETSSGPRVSEKNQQWQP